jgi:hypothetical protein
MFQTFVLTLHRFPLERVLLRGDSCHKLDILALLVFVC